MAGHPLEFHFHDEDLEARRSGVQVRKLVCGEPGSGQGSKSCNAASLCAIRPQTFLCHGRPIPQCPHGRGGGLSKSFQSPRLLPIQDPAHAVPSAWDAFLSPLPDVLPQLTLLTFQVSDTATVPPRCLPWPPHKVGNHAPCRFTQTHSPGLCPADDPCQASLARVPELEDLTRFAVLVSSRLVRGQRSVQTCGRDRLTARWSPSLRL